MTKSVRQRQELDLSCCSCNSAKEAPVVRSHKCAKICAFHVRENLAIRAPPASPLSCGRGPSRKTKERKRRMGSARLTARAKKPGTARAMRIVASQSPCVAAYTARCSGTTTSRGSTLFKQPPRSSQQKESLGRTGQARSGLSFLESSQASRPDADLF